MIKVIQLHARGGYTVRTIFMDNEFEKVTSELSYTMIDTTAVNEHLEEIDQRIQVIKERSQCIINTLLLKSISELVIIECIHFVTIWSNNFSRKNSVSQKYNPTKVVE